MAVSCRGVVLDNKPGEPDFRFSVVRTERMVFDVDQPDPERGEAECFGAMKPPGAASPVTSGTRCFLVEERIADVVHDTPPLRLNFGAEEFERRGQERTVVNVIRLEPVHPA